MHIVILADDQQKSELLLKNKSKNVTIKFVNNYTLLSSYTNADALFILQNEINIDELRSFALQPVFIHSVVSTLSDLNLSANISRLNAWPTFLQRDIWEIATKDETFVQSIFEKIGWKYCITPDEPGFIAARIIAMIINEAYFALEDGVSGKDEIDIAMQAGTNYPYGPFKWAQKIGLSNVYNLLKKLNKNNKRYDISRSLQNELANNE
jgi:3-hydroxybutyryl-CoA dehydrogenase